MAITDIPGPGLDSAQLQLLLDGVSAYGWIFRWGMFVFLGISLGALAWILLDASRNHVQPLKALAPGIMSLAGALLVLPAFIFRYTGNDAAGAIRLAGEPGPPRYMSPIHLNVVWLISGYGPKIALLAIFGAATAILGLAVYVVGAGATRAGSPSRTLR